MIREKMRIHESQTPDDYELPEAAYISKCQQIG